MKYEDFEILKNNTNRFFRYSLALLHFSSLNSQNLPVNLIVHLHLITLQIASQAPELQIFFFLSGCPFQNLMDFIAL